MIEDMCKFFADIEANPKNKISWTVRDYFNACEHLKVCDICYMRHQRVLAKAPQETILDQFKEN